MTKEEVAQVVAYCDENKISYKQRLAVLGIKPWRFYDVKRKYAPKEDGENAALIPGGTYHISGVVVYLPSFHLFRIG